MRTKIYVLFMIVVIALSPANVFAKASGKAQTAIITEEQKALVLNHVQLRVKEISSMDFSQLNKAERKSLKEELKGLKKEVRDVGPGGIYISAGALILIIVLLIILL